MGLFDLLCSASQLPIVNQPVVLVFTMQDGERWTPIAPLIRGTYNGYGVPADIVYREVARDLIARLTALHASGALTLDEDPTNPFGGEPSEASLAGFIEHVRQGGILASMQDHAPRVRVEGRALGYVMFLEDIYDAVVEMRDDTDEGRAFRERIEEQPFEASLEAAVGRNDLSPRLLGDSPFARSVLDDLTLFRTWFDARGTWAGSYIGDQYSARERRELAKRAKTELAQWGSLVHVVEQYEASLRGW